MPGEDSAAVVNDEGVLSEQHHVPVLLVGQPVLHARHFDVAGRGSILAHHVSSHPDLSAIHCNHVEECLVVNFAIVDVKGKLLARKAVVKRVEAAQDVPLAVEQVIIDRLDDLGWLSARGVVHSVRWRQCQTLVVNVQALHHGGGLGVLVALRAGKSARSVVVALTRTLHVLATEGVANAVRDFAGAVARDARHIPNRQQAILINVFAAISVKEVLNDLIIHYGLLCRDHAHEEHV